MPSLYQGSVERHAAVEFEKEDGRGNQKSVAASAERHAAAKRIGSLLQVDLPLRVLFQAPTVAELAERIEQRESAVDKLEDLVTFLSGFFINLPIFSQKTMLYTLALPLLTSKPETVRSYVEQIIGRLLATWLKWNCSPTMRQSFIWPRKAHGKQD